MRTKLKPRLCKYCKAEYTPKTEWQKYHKRQCRTAVYNRGKLALLRRAERIIRAQEVAGAGA